MEYLIRYCELIFSDKLPAFCPELAPQARTPKRSRPKSLAISTPTKLLSLEEARSRALGVSSKADQKYIEVGECGHWRAKGTCHAGFAPW